MENRRKFPTKSKPFVRATLTLFCTASIFSFVAGCDVKKTPVNGAVRLDGKPLAAASVALIAVNGGPLVSGVTDAEGRFQLETAGRAGVKPGEYRVTVIKKEVTAASTDKDGHVGTVTPGRMAQEKWLTPPKYASPDTSGLTITVKPGMTSLDCDLKSR